MDDAIQLLLSIKSFFQYVKNDSSAADVCRDMAEFNDKISEFIANHCEHDFVTDSFDITPTNTSVVVYCQKCYVIK